MPILSNFIRTKVESESRGRSYIFSPRNPPRFRTLVLRDARRPRKGERKTPRRKRARDLFMKFMLSRGIRNSDKREAGKFVSVSQRRATGRRRSARRRRRPSLSLSHLPRAHPQLSPIPRRIVTASSAPEGYDAAARGTRAATATTKEGRVGEIGRLSGDEVSSVVEGVRDCGGGGKGEQWGDLHVAEREYGGTVCALRDPRRQLQCRSGRGVVRSFGDESRSLTTRCYSASRPIAYHFPRPTFAPARAVHVSHESDGVTCCSFLSPCRASASRSVNRARETLAG